ncbi:hypothetical protein ACFOW1_10415 [Parasediminibacterium paludis]|uniref:Uncharacterized protein n=1 Tax=Parasediminibacterium paludis TaxID=908966 RepID=A0ABV8PZ38_9BACT
MKKSPSTKTIALLLGFVTGFIFLLTMFIALGVAIESIFIISIFFTVIITAIAMLLSNSKPKIIQ